jgi:hypothetical protein
MAGTIFPLQTSNAALPAAATTCWPFSAEVDACCCFMNSSASPELVVEQRGSVRNIVHPQHHEHWSKEAAP